MIIAIDAGRRAKTKASHTVRKVKGTGLLPDGERQMQLPREVPPLKGAAKLLQGGRRSRCRSRQRREVRLSRSLRQRANPKAQQPAAGLWTPAEGGGPWRTYSGKAWKPPGSRRRSRRPRRQHLRGERLKWHREARRRRNHTARRRRRRRTTKRKKKRKRRTQRMRRRASSLKPALRSAVRLRLQRRSRQRQQARRHLRGPAEWTTQSQRKERTP
mmetsp:Transcript_52324/g.156140  ORF Transcript_52324/g.156140 Transcript_52324/m.156140 type:complete len:215 (+) Transcript_52324:630-1274(+)